MADSRSGYSPGKKTWYNLELKLCLADNRGSVSMTCSLYISCKPVVAGQVSG